MKIAVIGAGNVGATLGTRWALAGHTVKFGSRDPLADSVLATVAKGGGNASAALVPDAAAFADVVVFATPYAALKSVVEGAGPFGDKVLIDCINPVLPDFSGVVTEGPSTGELVAQWSGSSRVVKCFNTVGFNIMADPVFAGKAASMLYAGDDSAAKATVASLAADLGFEPIDAGPLKQAKWLETFAWLWISMAIQYGHGREMAFSLLKR